MCYQIFNLTYIWTQTDVDWEKIIYTLLHSQLLWNVNQLTLVKSVQNRTWIKLKTVFIRTLLWSQDYRVKTVVKLCLIQRKCERVEQEMKSKYNVSDLLEWLSISVLYWAFWIYIWRNCFDTNREKLIWTINKICTEYFNGLWKYCSVAM
jgi:hypothetical protein